MRRGGRGRGRGRDEGYTIREAEYRTEEYNRRKLHEILPHQCCNEISQTHIVLIISAFPPGRWHQIHCS